MNFDLADENDGMNEVTVDQIMTVDDLSTRTSPEQVLIPMPKRVMDDSLMDEILLARLFHILPHPAMVGKREKYHRLVRIVSMRNARMTGTGMTSVTCLEIL